MSSNLIVGTNNKVIIMDIKDSIHTLEILSEPHELTKAKFKFNRKLYENVKWKIVKNVLYFEGDHIKTDCIWHIRRSNLDKIEDKFIETFTERYGFLWLRKREYKGVIGQYIFKKRIHKKITTNVWSIIDHNEGGSNGRINSKEQNV